MGYNSVVCEDGGKQIYKKCAWVRQVSPRLTNHIVFVAAVEIQLLSYDLLMNQLVVCFKYVLTSLDNRKGVGCEVADLVG